ncbi:MAG TPA: urate hydroxylase PuuD [Gammaproteobacteria bacterium]|nr:urate hydroxylase PuuD [Gammaproteobacteria bacterium]
MNPFNTIKGTLASGFALAIIVAFFIKSGFGPFNDLSFYRWFHIMAGITWIGLLYYFNFVQIPALNAAAADTGGPGGAGITKYVAPRALLWFRWAAVVTWLTGFFYLWSSGNLGAFALGMLGDAVNVYQLTIGLGAWFGTIMIFNVWVLIWPNQKKVLGIVPASDEEKAKARRVAFLASRTNTFLSIPMLLCMGSAAHGLPF